MGEAQWAQSGAKDPGSERGCLFGLTPQWVFVGSIVSMGTSFNGPGSALTRLTRWALTCRPLLRNVSQDGDT